MEKITNSVSRNLIKNQSIHRESSYNNYKMFSEDSLRKLCDQSSCFVVPEDIFSWLPRSYTCSYCKREFRSAQALGGHMNVHRRERARLMREPPPRNGHEFSIYNLDLDPNQNPNPNLYPKPNISSSSSLSQLTSSLMFRQPFTSNLPPLVSPPSNLSGPSLASENRNILCRANHSLVDYMGLSSSTSDNLSNIKTTKALTQVGNFDDFVVAGKKGDCGKKAEVVRVNLEIGMLCDSKIALDLELRLGCSSMDS